MKHVLLTLPLTLLSLSIFGQFSAFPNSDDANFQLLDAGEGWNFNSFEVDPTELPAQNALFTEVTSLASGNWDDPLIWDCECVPTELNSVTLSSGHNIDLSHSIEVHTLHIMENSSLNNVPDTQADVTIKLDLAVYGSLNLEECSLYLDGITNQVLYGNCDVAKVVIIGNNTVLVEGNLMVSRELWIGSSTLETSGRVYLTQNESGTAELAPIFNGTIVGNINLSRDISITQNGWVNLCSPVADATVQTVVDDFLTTGFIGSDFPNNSFNSVNYYVEESDDFTTDYAGVTNATDPMPVGRGYYVFALAGDYTFNVTGAPTFGDVSLPVGFTDNASPSTDGLNLVANPYAATLNWDSETGWDKENMVGALYVWDGSQKQFRTYINGVGVNGGSAFIRPMESFWVMAAGADPELNVNESAKSLHASETQEVSTNMVVSLSNETWSDQLVITASADGNLEFDPQNDALKFYGDNSVPNFSTLSSDDVKLAINSIPELSEAIDLEVVINIPVAGDYTMSFAGVEDYINNKCIALEDLVSGESYDLQNTTEFTFNSGVVSDETRFVFHIGAPIELQASSIACTGDAEGEILAQGSGDGPWDYTWFDADMNQLGETFGEAAGYSIADLNAGEYFVRIDNNDFCNSLMVSAEVTEPEVPLTINNVVENIPCEENSSGEITLQTLGGMQPYMVEWDNGMQGANIENLEPGMYTYTVTDGVGCVKTETLELTEAVDVEVEFTMVQQVITLDGNNEAVVDFINNSEGTTNHEWNFGDGVSTSTAESPSHMFTQPGFYTVSLYSYNDDCDGYYQAVVVVNQFEGVGIEELDFNDQTVIQLIENDLVVSSITNQNQNVTVEVYDLLGKTIASQTGQIGSSNRIKISLDSANALYIVSVVNSETGQKTRRKISRF